MKKMIRILQLEWVAIYVWAFILVALFELEVFPVGEMAGNAVAEYYLSLAGIAMMVVLVPMSLKLMTFRMVKASFAKDEVSARSGYKRWSEVRMAMLAVAGWSNLGFYYLTLNSTSSFCALIVALALLFCRPSRDKFEGETGLVWKKEL